MIPTIYLFKEAKAVKRGLKRSADETARGRKGGERWSEIHENNSFSLELGHWVTDAIQKFIQLKYVVGT